MDVNISSSPLQRICEYNDSYVGSCRILNTKNDHHDVLGLSRE